MLLEHLDHIKKYDNENSNQKINSENLETDDSETTDPERALGEEGELAE